MNRTKLNLARKGLGITNGDIAGELGISEAQVSLALSDSKQTKAVQEKTLELILKKNPSFNKETVK